jgi:hypothetical protein
MSRSGEITLAFGDGEYTFRLAIGQWRKIQEACDAGPPEILARMAPVFEAMRRGVSATDLISAGLLGRWRIDDIRGPIFQGLLGGGMEPPKAAQLIRDWVDERPLLEALPIAYLVVKASFTGVGDEDASGGAKGETVPPLSPVESSGSDKTDTTPSAAPSDGPPGRSTTSRSGNSRRRSAATPKPTAPAKPIN